MDPIEFIDETGLTHLSASVASPVALCGRSALVVDDDGFEVNTYGLASRGTCPRCGAA